MSGIGAISGFSATMSYQMSGRAMLDVEAADEGDEDVEFLAVSENTDEIEFESEDDSEMGESGEVSELGGQIDAWG